MQGEHTMRHARGGTHKDRHTWIQAMVKDKEWVPGPGRYKTEREFMLKDEDEVDTNHSIQESAPAYSFEKEKKETLVKMKDLKLRRNNGNYPKTEPYFVPGPGTYAAYSTFGTASGGHRQTYLGGKPRHNWDIL